MLIKEKSKLVMIIDLWIDEVDTQYKEGYKAYKNISLKNEL